MAAPTKREVELLPQQWEFLSSTAPETLYSGAAGGGKTRILCQTLVDRAVGRPGTMWGLTRKHNVTLENTTLNTLLNEENGLPPVLPRGYYTHNISKQYIQIHNGGRIVYFGLDAPKGKPPLKVGSLNLAGLFIDEGIELGEKDYEMLETRVRQPDPKNPGKPGQIFIATNPGAPAHWMFKKFFKKGGAPKNDEFTKVIQCRTSDNSYLPGWYLERLNRMTGQMYLRYVLGQWIGFEGQVYGEVWRPDLHVLRPGPDGMLRNENGSYERPLNAWGDPVRVGVDEGFTHPACFLEFRKDNDGRLLMSKEFYRTKLTHEDLANEASRFSTAPYCVDSAVPNLIKAMNKKPGVRAKGVKKYPGSVKGGINLVMARLAPEMNGLPRLFVHESCENWIDEMGLYVWDDDKDEPVDEFNHACDAGRYAILDLDGKDNAMAHF